MFVNAKEKAVNVIKFNASGFSMLSGQLKIVASYKISSKSVRFLQLGIANFLT